MTRRWLRAGQDAPAAAGVVAGPSPGRSSPAVTAPAGRGRGVGRHHGPGPPPRIAGGRPSAPRAWVIARLRRPGTALTRSLTSRAGRPVGRPLRGSAVPATGAAGADQGASGAGRPFGALAGVLGGMALRRARPGIGAPVRTGRAGLRPAAQGREWSSGPASAGERCGAVSSVRSVPWGGGGRGGPATGGRAGPPGRAGRAGARPLRAGDLPVASGGGRRGRGGRPRRRSAGTRAAPGPPRRRTRERCPAR